MVIRITFPILFLLLSSHLDAQQLVFEEIDLSFEQPVDIVSSTISNDPRLFIVEKTGKVFIIDDPQSENPTKLPDPYLDLSSVVDDSGEGGLLGMAFSPEYELKGYVFVNYTFKNPVNNNVFSSRISRFNVSQDDPNKIDPTTEVAVLTVVQPEDNHNGGDLLFGPDNMLYVPFGDGGGSNDIYENGQNKQSLLGKVLRIDVKTLPYSIPTDNPFRNDDEVLDEIWSMGWRNPWRSSFDRETGDLWAGDVGQNTYEEINFEMAGSTGGLNFGWNCFEGDIIFGPFACLDPIVHAEPLHLYSHDFGQKSVTGGYVYRGERHPDLIGKYVFTDFVDSEVWWIIEKDGDMVDVNRIELEGMNLPAKVSTLGEATNGELYFATFEDGKIWSLMTTVIKNNENSEWSKISISPNPVLDVLKFRNVNSNSWHYEIIDVVGNIVLDGNLNNSEIMINALSTGSYVVILSNLDAIISIPFIKI